jgi:hypothetical protein
MRHLLRVCVLLAVASSSAFAVSSKEPQVPVKVKLDVSHPPTVEAEIVDARWRPSPGDVQLRIAPNGPAVSSQNLRTFAEAGPRTAIAFVMDGSQIWTQHALDAFEKAVNAAGFARRLPTGSDFVIITYAVGATVRVPLSPISQPSGASFGTPNDYDQQTGGDLVAGINLAIEQLERSNAPVKLLIVAGDGADRDRDHAKANFAQLEERLAAADIRVGALVDKNVRSPAEWDIRPLVTQAFEGGAAGFTQQLEIYVTRLTDRFYATFDVTTLPVFTGRSVTLQVEMPGKAIVPVTVTFPAAGSATEPTPGWTSSSWLQACAAICLFAMLAAFMRSLARE